MHTFQAGCIGARVWTPYGHSVKRTYSANARRVRFTGCTDVTCAFRYNKARQLKHAQDTYCAKVEAGKFEEVADIPYPEDLQWEALVDILRGRVKVDMSTHILTRFIHIYVDLRFKSIVTSRWIWKPL